MNGNYCNNDWIGTPRSLREGLSEPAKSNRWPDSSWKDSLHFETAEWFPHMWHIERTKTRLEPTDQMLRYLSSARSHVRTLFFQKMKVSSFWRLILRGYGFRTRALRQGGRKSCEPTESDARGLLVTEMVWFDWGASKIASAQFLVFLTDYPNSYIYEGSESNQQKADFHPYRPCPVSLTKIASNYLKQFDFGPVPHHPFSPDPASSHLYLFEAIEREISI
jgi:hypothetical protein